MCDQGAETHQNTPYRRTSPLDGRSASFFNDRKEAGFIRQVVLERDRINLSINRRVIIVKT